MPKRMTQKQLTANRLNAQNSTGPKTDEGKAQSSQNALKHGLLAREAVITSGRAAEDPAEFRALLADFRDELRPTGLIQETLVERMATCYWRLRRAQRLEIAAIRYDSDIDPNVNPAAAAVEKLQCSEKRAVTNLQEDEQSLEYFEHPPDPNAPDDQAEFHSLLTNFAEAFRMQTTDRSDEDLRADLVIRLGKDIARQAHDLGQLRRQLLNAKRDLEAQQSCRPPDSSLPRHDTLVRLSRYESMLDRQFHRALTELRRRQSARSPSKAKK